MSDLLAHLDKPCSTCGRPSGDHTLREWNVCMGTTTTHLPYEPIPSDSAAEVNRRMREQFQLDDDLIVADHFIAKALTLEGTSGPVRIKVPALLHEFQIGIAGQPPITVAKVLYSGDVGTMRAYGRLVRDTANGAANAAEREAA